MHPRQTIIESFSTFLEFAEDRVKGWVSIPHLRRNMRNCLQQLPESKSSENFWAIYWYQLWQQSHSLARLHLSAYLQESCYWSAYKIVSSLANAQYRLSDCFQIAIAEIDKVLKGFKPQQGFSLKSYASATFKGVIIDTLRQHQEIDFCSDWTLLHRISQKRLEKSLSNAGVNSEQIEHYCLAWNCFKKLYTPSNTGDRQQLPPPDPATWKAIAQLYNSERHSQLTAPGEECSPETLENCLKQSVKWVRHYLYPQVTSLNQLKPGKESHELGNYLLDEQESLLTKIIAEEETQKREAQKHQIHTVLVSALEQLQIQEQQILQLYYGQGFTQQQIGQQLALKQYTVSRKLAKACEFLLMALAAWGQHTSQISLNSNVLKDMSAVMEEWLHEYFENSQHFIYHFQNEG
ncbi:sigma-70 family RNA polymerase sigma factor [Nostoc sp. FACHB-152]|uniref:sigma-70 family RNA polymerase sigma factor n=1 Tax=unclassified Nostoc TaxID=2593658 RepID=UPI001689824C|nr:MULTISPECIES: sigma-70 family RNA polymerase sigma factor [unclassified Nostoc]MBD2449122.1 sigma-70 family RNA polymerase sigma factor [Nostoc sp. FACHB-152]MBD2470378.1 sigma-70 family RNA polymerase sigma factor [Nostoc sp. FACHB-145]